MMSYEELLKAWRGERESEGLSKLPEDFYARASGLISELREKLRMADPKALRTRLVRRELENVEKMLEDIFGRRLEKVVRGLMAGEPLDLEKLTPEERELFSSLEEDFRSARKFLEDLLRGSLKAPKKAGGPAGARARQGKLMLVRITADIPAIVGSDMRTHGPFKRGDIAFIPRENAMALVRKGLAVEVELA